MKRWTRASIREALVKIDRGPFTKNAVVRSRYEIDPAGGATLFARRKATGAWGRFGTCHLSAIEQITKQGVKAVLDAGLVRMAAPVRVDVGAPILVESDEARPDDDEDATWRIRIRAALG